MAVEPNMARRLWHVVRAVLFMLRKGMPKRKLAMDLHLLVHRGKIAGKALGNLMTAHGHNSHHHHDKQATAAEAAAPPPPKHFSCGRGRGRRALDPSLAVYDPREVEFSCSNTPSYPSLHLIPTGKRRRRNNNNSSGRRGTHRGANGAEPGWYNYDAADIARVFEILNNNDQLLSGGDTSSDQQPSPLALIATPSPALWASFGRTPAHVRQLRITDSPFPLGDDTAAGGDGQVDLDAEEFIKKFYEQLRTQQSLATATPDYYGGGYARPVSGIA